jgi:hypothetical protein
MEKENKSGALLPAAHACVIFFLVVVSLCAAQSSPPQSATAPSATSTPPQQPIPFSHKTHVAAELTCLFCHQNPDPGNQISFPTTAQCMACHAGIAKDRPTIRKLAQLDREHQVVPWVRVYAVPAFVYWSHRTHSDAGLKCESCHGQVDQMEIMTKTTNVTTMGGCVECHRRNRASTGCKACHESQSSWLQGHPRGLPSEVALRGAILGEARQ